MARITPLGAIARGMAAGIVGSYAIGMFFRMSGKFAPDMSPKGEFKPPQEKDAQAEPTVKVARRVVEDFMKAGELTERQKEVGGQVVHFAMGAGYGAMYGLVRESFPSLSGALGAIGFATGVWSFSDHVLLPAFRLAPPIHKTKTSVHGYMYGAHIVYAAAVWGTYELLTPAGIPALIAAAYAYAKPSWSARMYRRYAKPVIETAKDYLEPALEYAKPALKYAKPVVEFVAPVTGYVEPVYEMLKPRLHGVAETLSDVTA